MYGGATHVGHVSDVTDEREEIGEALNGAESLPQISQIYTDFLGECGR